MMSKIIVENSDPRLIVIHRCLYKSQYKSCVTTILMVSSIFWRGFFLTKETLITSRTVQVKSLNVCVLSNDHHDPNSK